MTRPRCLIGIPTLNGPDRLQRLLHSIAQCTDFSRFDARVVVADDGSSPQCVAGNVSVVNEFSRGGVSIDLLPAPGRTGIAATWNRIVRHDASKHFDVVVLVNDDIEVVDDWLDVLAFSVLNNPRAGMIGLNTYCGTTKAQYLEKHAPARVDYAEARLMDGGGSLIASHGPIFAFHRSTYETVGGFDERYFVFYEEVDFGVTLRKRGFQHYMASYPIVYHMGGATNSDPRNLDAQKHIAESRRKFQDKWGSTLDRLREGFVKNADALRMAGISVPVVEWNTQLKVWRDE